MKGFAHCTGFRETDTEKAYALVEEHNRGLVNDPNDYYSIHTGRKIAMFTLYHYYRPEGDLPPQYNPYRYVRNLSTTLEEAVHKAIEIAGSHWLVLECDSTLKYDYSGEIFQFGKYKGERIENAQEYVGSSDFKRCEQAIRTLSALVTNMTKNEQGR